MFLKMLKALAESNFTKAKNKDYGLKRCLKFYGDELAVSSKQNSIIETYFVIIKNGCCWPPRQ